MADITITGGQNNIRADVDKFGAKNRLLTESIALTVAFEETETGNGYNINTGVINLTSANKSAVLYIKNNEDKDIVLEKIFYIIGNSTGGTGDLRVTILRNPTTGTLIDGATNVDINSNRNFGSNLTLDADVFKGAEGNTFTNGEACIDTIFPSSGLREVLSVGGIVLPQGASVGIEITPQTSNTSMDVMVAAETYRITLTI